MWIVDDDQPFTTLENKYFRQMVRMLNPDALVPSADTIKKNVMECFKEEQDKMKKLFQVSFNVKFVILFKYNIYIIFINLF